MQEEVLPYFPHDVFGSKDGVSPRVFISPGRYVQGAGVLGKLGQYLTPLGSQHVGVLASPGRMSAEGDRLESSLESNAMSSQFFEFGGEASLEEINALVERLDGTGVDTLVAFGGGKCVDTGKAVAYRLGLPVVVIPSLASNDAPCSALSVIYSTAGDVESVEFYPSSPALVVVDSQVVADAPARYLAAGMGDAMATWFEARAVSANPEALSSIGGKQTLAALAIGERCASTIFEHGAEAMRAVRQKTVTPALDNVIEANTLLSGLGFESGGLAVAHAVASALPTVKSVHDNHLHGEMVAIGLLAQLVIERQKEDFDRVAELFSTVGLPVRLNEISIDRTDTETVNRLAETTMGFNIVNNVAAPVDASIIYDSLMAIDG